MRTQGIIFAVVLVLSTAVQAQHEHHADSMTMPHSAQNPALPDFASYPDATEEMRQAVAMSRHMHGDSVNWLLMADRFEWADDDQTEQWQWEMQGWLGKDEHKLWFKTEGAYSQDTGRLDDAELQLLYSRAISPFWDVQAGWRHDEGEAASRDYLVLGLMGLAPYWFEVDAAAFISEQGRVSARLEAEYELFLTQRLVLQPRLELNYAFADDAGAQQWQGMNEGQFGLRLRYELRREFAPYLGLQWWRSWGAAGEQLRSAGLDDGEMRVVAGLRFWY